MIVFLGFAFLLAVVDAGPWMGRPRPMAAPAVDATQWDLHQRFLDLEPLVLQQSLDVSRLAQSTTEECYRRTDEAAARLHYLSTDFDKLVHRVRPVAPNCVDFKSLRKALGYFEKAAEDVYQCTHSLSDVAASFEVEMTLKIVAARAQIMDIKKAMWFCQKYRPEVDEECLHRLTREGRQILAKLPERTRAVADRAVSESEAVLGTMRRCLVAVVSAAEERHLAETEAVRQCSQGQSQGVWRDSSEN